MAAQQKQTTDQVLEKWYLTKQRLSALQSEEKNLRDRVQAAMTSRNMTTLKTERFQVTLKTVNRESLSKRDCPSAIWKQHCKNSSYQMMKIVSLTDPDGPDGSDDDLAI